MKKALSFILAAALVISLMPTFVFAATGDSFNVNLYDVMGKTADELTNYYAETTTAGEGWKINVAETASGHFGASRLQVAKKDPAFSGFRFWTIPSGMGNFAVSFTAPKAGCYKVYINVVPYKGGGTEIKASLNGSELLTFNAYGSMEEWGEALTGVRKTEVGTVSLRSGEYANTIIFAPQNGNLYFEGITLEEVEAYPTPVIFNFYNELDPKPAKGMSVAATAGPGFITIAEESSTYVNDTRSYSAGGYAYPQFDICKGATTWINSNNDRGSKWTFRIPISAAGWYDVDFIGAKWFANDDFYLYVDDQFAGYYNFYSAKSAANNNGNNIELGDRKEMNSLYLTPDEDGYVKVMLAIAKSNGYGHGRLAPIEMRLTPSEDQDIKCVDIVHTLPEELSFGDTAEFTAYALMSDGSRRSFNGYNSTATADADNGLFITSATSGISITRTSDQLFDEGLYAGTVSGSDFGTQKVTLTAKIGGATYSEEATINVANPETPVAFKLGLSDNDFTVSDVNGGYGTQADWKLIGATVVPEKTTTVQSRQYIYAWGKFNQFSTAGGYSVWPNLTTDSQQVQITLRKNIPCAGYYDIDFTGYLWNASSDYAIYVNGDFAGHTNCYVTPDAWGSTATTRLNKLYLPAGVVEISFRARKSHYTGSVFFTPKEMTFTPATVAEIKVSEVETSGIPATMEAGATVDASAKAKMTDGEYRSFGFTNEGFTPTEDDVIKVSSSNPAVVAVTDVDCVHRITKEFNEVAANTIDPKTTTYKLNALRAGTADITVTAIVDGIAASTTKTITVSGEAMEETISKKTASVSIVALEGGSVATSLGNAVDNVALGTEISATATADAGYKFAYWQNSNGNVLSTNASETFVINTNTSIKAYFEKIVAESDATAPVYFYNGNGEALKSEVVEKGKTFADVTKPVATLTGYVFESWSIADDAVITDVTRAVALFGESDAKYSVTVIDGDSATTQSGKAYGEEITVTASGNNFSYWMLGDDIVGYNKTLKIKVYGNMTLTAAYIGAKAAVPTVALEESGGSYFLTYNVPAGYTKLEAGIIFSESGTPRIGACYSKAIERTGSGQFTAKPMGDETIARGYVMFRDADGNIRVIYAD